MIEGMIVMVITMFILIWILGLGLLSKICDYHSKII